METDTETVSVDSGEGTSNIEASSLPSADGQTSDTATSSIFSEGFTFADNWTDQLEGDQFNDSRATLANYKDFGAVAQALVDNKRAATARTEGLTKIPDANSTPEEIAAYRTTIGIPETVDQYQIDLPEQLPEGVEFIEGDLEGFKQFAFEAGLTPEQASKIIEFQVSAESNAISGINAEQEAYVEDQQKALRDEWGSQWEQKQMNAKRAAATFGLDPNHPAMNDAAVVKAMAQAADAISEDKLVPGDKLTGQLSPGNEAADIMNNSDNALYVAYHDTGHPQHEQAVNTYLRKLEEQTKREGF